MPTPVSTPNQATQISSNRSTSAPKNERLKNLAISQGLLFSSVSLTNFFFWCSTRKAVLSVEGTGCPPYQGHEAWFWSTAAYTALTDSAVTSATQVGVNAIRLGLRRRFSRQEQTNLANLSARSRFISDFLAALTTANLTSAPYLFIITTRQNAQINTDCLPLQCDDYHVFANDILWFGQLGFSNVFLILNYAIDRGLNRSGLYKHVTSFMMQLLEGRVEGRAGLLRFFDSLEQLVELTVRGAAGAGIGALAGLAAYPFNRVRAVAVEQDNLRWQDVPGEMTLEGYETAAVAFCLIGLTFGFVAHFLSKVFDDEAVENITEEPSPTDVEANSRSAAVLAENRV